MRCLSLYLFRQTLVAFLFAVAAVSVVVLFTQSFRLLSLVMDNAGTLLIFLQLMGLLIPTFLPLVLPLATGVATLFVYHKLAAESELVVMRAAGISSLRLALPALALAALVTLGVYGLTLWATPAANRALVALQYKVKDNFSLFLVRPGMFNDIADGLTFYVRARGKDGTLKDILIHDIRRPARPVTIMAESGQFIATTDPPQIVVLKGRRQEFDRATGRLSQLDFDRYVLDFQILRSSVAARLPDPREQSMADLVFFSSETSVPRRSTRQRVVAEFHQRLAVPWLAFSYTLIGVSAVLAGAFHRRGMAPRLIGAAVAIIGVQAATLALSSLGGKSALYIPALYAVILLPIPALLALLAVPGWRGRARPVDETPAVEGTAP